MLNLNMMIGRLDDIIFQGKSELKIERKDEGNKFEDFVLSNKNLILDKKNNNKDVKFDSQKVIEVEIEDKEKLLKDLSEALDNDYTEDELADIANLYLLTNFIMENKSFSIDNIELIRSLDSDMFELENVYNILSTREVFKDLNIEKNTLEDTLKNLKIETPKLMEEIFEDLNVQGFDLKDNLSKVNINEVIKSNNIKDLNIGEFILDEDTLKVKLNTSNSDSVINKYLTKISGDVKLDGLEVNMDKLFEDKEYVKIMEVTESIILKDEDNIKVNIFDDYNKEQILDRVEIEQSIDAVKLFKDKNEAKLSSKKIEDFKNIIDSDDISVVLNKNSKSHIEDKNSFNNFLINQRISSLKMNDKTLDTTEDKLNSLVELESSVVKNDASDMLSPNTYSFNSAINDTMGSNSAPSFIRYSSMETDMLAVIQYMKASSIKELTLKINPKELGEVSINVLKKGDISNVVITVEREDILKSLKNSISAISSELKETGVKVDSISVQIKSENNTFNFMSDSQRDNFENSNNSFHQKRKNTQSTEKIAVNEMTVSDVNSNIQTENEINLLA